MYMRVLCACQNKEHSNVTTFEELFNFNQGGSTAMDVYTDDEKQLEDGESKTSENFRARSRTPCQLLTSRANSVL